MKGKRYVLGKRDDYTHLFVGGIAGLIFVMGLFWWMTEHLI